MKVTTRVIIGTPVRAGSVVGKIDDVFFDVRTADITHMSVALTGWSRGTIVLLPCDGCRVLYAGGGLVFRDMSADAIRNAPLLDEETAWNPDVVEAMATFQDTVPLWMLNGRFGATATRSESIERKTSQRALWGSRDLRRAIVSHGSDTELGRLEDLLLDTDTWRITHVVVRQGHWYWPVRVSIPADTILEVEDTGTARRLVLLPTAPSLVA